MHDPHLKRWHQCEARDAPQSRDTSTDFPDILAKETEMFDQLGLRTAGPKALADTSEPVLEWLRSTGAKHLAIHFDLDVLDPKLFRSLLFSNPDPSVPSVDTYPSVA